MFTFVYFIPVLATILWFITFALKADVQRRKAYTLVLAGEFFFYVLYSVFVLPETDYSLMVHLDAVLVPVSLLAPALFVLFMHRIRSGKKAGGMYALLFLPAIMFGSSVGVLYYLIGWEDAAAMARFHHNGIPFPAEFSSDLYKLYYLFDYTLKHLIAFLMMLAVITEAVLCLLHENTEQKTSIAWLTIAQMLLLFPTALLGRKFMVEHNWLSAVIALLIGIVIHFRCQAVFSGNVGLLHFLGHRKPEQLHEEDNARLNYTKLLEERLKTMIDKDRIYLDDSLTVGSLARTMGVSRSTMSNVVGSVFGTGFRELINNRRIEYAKQYMLEHPKATQEEIAMECGFKDGNLFNRKFRAVEGRTPLSWLLNNIK